MRKFCTLTALVVIMVVPSLALLEVGLRVFFPQYQLNYADSTFSERYHHTSETFDAMRSAIRQNPDQFRGEKTIVILGDSFVAGREVKPEQNWTALLQEKLGPKIKVVSLGFVSYSTLIYERLYRDVVLPLKPNLVILCLDETDASDDYLYEKEFQDGTGSPLDRPFGNTVLRHFENYPVRLFLLRHSRAALLINGALRRLFGEGLMPKYVTADNRGAEKIKLYIESIKDAATGGALFANSEKYLTSLIQMKPKEQELFFVTYPRAENLAGQRKSTIIKGSVPDSHHSVPFFVYWFKEKKWAKTNPQVHFVDTTEAFRQKIAQTHKQYYFYEDDVHWNPDGHLIFADMIYDKIVSPSLRKATQRP